MTGRTSAGPRMKAVQVLPGPGIVARYGDVLVWMEEGDDGGGPLTRDLLALARDLAEDGAVEEAGPRLAELLRRDPKAVPALVLVAPAAEGIRVVVHGWGRLVTDEVQIDGGWADRRIAWATALAAGRSGHLLGMPTPDSLLDLRRGSTPGGGAAVILADRGPVAAPSAAEVPQVTAPAPTHAADLPPSSAMPTSFELVDRSEDHGDPLPTGGRLGSGGPTVKGVVCGQGHFNNPIAVTCATCGTSMGQVSRILQDGTRPSLGALVLDDGTAYGLDTDHLVGSAPEGEAAAGAARPVRLVDVHGQVAPVHAEIRLVGWDVLLVARGPTFVLPHGTQQWTPLPPGQPTPLPAGARVAIGQRTFLVESEARNTEA